MSNNKTLIIHHLETIWERGYHNKGTDFETLARNMIKWIKRNRPDRVILTQFEDWQPSDDHYDVGIADYVNDWYDYSYGWDTSSLDEDELAELEAGTSTVWAWGGVHSEIVRLDDWMYDLKEVGKVYIAGAFDGECVEDLECALNALDIPFKRVESLIV